MFYIAIITITAIAFFNYFYATKQKIIRTLKKLPNTSINRLKTGEFSKITGKALHVTAPLIAPLSKRKCIFYTVKIEQKKQRGKNSYWEKIVDDEKIQDFFVEKNGDVVMLKPQVAPKNYKSYLVVDTKTSSGYFNDPDTDFTNILSTYNIESKGLLGFNKRLKYSEGIIEIGEEITVAGIANWKSLREPIEGYSYSKIATLESTNDQNLIITDLPKEKLNKTL